MRTLSFNLQLTPRIAICACLLLMPLSIFSQQSDFRNYTQDIAGTSLLFEMVAIPGGESVGDTATTGFYKLIK